MTKKTNKNDNITVRVKATGILEEYLTDDKKKLSIKVNTKLDSLVKQLKLPKDLECITSVNNTLVPKYLRNDTILNDKDVIVIVPPLKGG